MVSALFSVATQAFCNSPDLPVAFYFEFKNCFFLVSGFQELMLFELPCIFSYIQELDMVPYVICSPPLNRLVSRSLPDSDLFLTHLIAWSTLGATGFNIHSPASIESNVASLLLYISVCF
ncbi:unnamed protein product [Ilex paraguariensis]|uniref:Uncharacterized protein n=1 Tax=Ilex paraguariensis TaxID=185542 RepID=A0ABC8T543_9AQUA